MRLVNQQEAANTRGKLATFELHYKQASGRTVDTEALQDMTLYSFRQMIHQLKEECIQFACDLKSGRSEADTIVWPFKSKR